MTPATHRMRSLIERVRTRASALHRPGARDRGQPIDAGGNAERRVDHWWMDRVSVDEGGEVGFTGWTYAVDALQPLGNRAFEVNGRPADSVRFTTARPDMRMLFADHSEELPWSFECVAAPEPRYPDGVLELRRTNPRTRSQDRGRDLWVVPDPARHSRLPEPERRFRVLGNDDALGFLTSGATDYRRLDMACRWFAGKPLHGHDRVLDWGAGCGRVARHFPAPLATARLTGCDIDHDNVRWCQQNLPGTFVQSTLRPPLPFDDAGFDLVYGVSVFTHLRQPLQQQWLAELKRVTAPGALLLMTVHGSAAIEFMHLPPHRFAEIKRSVEAAGIMETSANTQIDGYADHDGEYVNVQHSGAYIQRVWGASFDVLDVLPGYVFTHDLVVMRRR